MPFIGMPFLQQVTERKLKLSGVRLAPGASGVLAFDDYGGLGQIDVHLGKLPHWQSFVNAIGDPVFLHQAITVTVNQRSGQIAPISVLKGGVDHATFQLVLKHEGALPAAASGELDVTIEFG